MKKAIRNIILGAMCGSMVFAVAGCNDNTAGIDTETRPVALALGAVDENFNPFVYTAQNDGEVVGMTQISMLTADAKGNIVCGQDEATVALDYSINMYDSGDNLTTDGDKAEYTVYEFVIKKGIKDSMGYDIGIKDALFNLYVYLDPVYSGSSTIYSTKIKGLAKYRAQDAGMSDDAEDSFSDEIMGAVKLRMDNLSDYDKENSNISYDSVKDDIKIVSNEFRKELESDWTAIEGTVNSYEEYRFTEDWEIYLWNQGIIKPQYFLNDQNNAERLKDESGKYLTTLDPKVEGVTINSMYEDKTKLREDVGGQEDKKQTAINLVYNEYFKVKDGNIVPSVTGQLNYILNYRSTGSTVRQQFSADEITKKAEALPDGELIVKSISGITTAKTSSFNGKDLGSEHDVLRIEINGVDPAAIYNFAYSVAPLHYYSGKFEGVDYVARADNYENESVSNRFGMVWGNSNFFKDVIDSPDKKMLPVGAGAYKARTDISFWNTSRAAYERNENFTTVGTGIENAKIKYLNYQVTTDDQILNSLIKGEIDYGQPNCTNDNVQAIADVKHLNNRSYLANGFGYVGINPTFIPEMEVRQAIMLAMNPQKYIIGGYYTSQYASMLYRPTSKTNFIFELGDSTRLNSAYTTRYNNVKLEYNAATVTDEIERLMGETEYKKVNGIYTKNGTPLKITFTIAGETTDHPAWQMFTDARDTLNGLGFDITVKTDRNALISLATGQLWVWAAAWTSGIDPDMYQVYHKDSNATSVKNWGYPAILSNQNHMFDRENEILDEMSEFIDNARSTTIKQTRANNYMDALDRVMDLAVELPTYQRNDLGVYNNTVIAASSLNREPSANAGLIYKIWELDYVK